VSQDSTRSPLLAVCLIAAGFLAAYHPALDAELDVRDDHEIIRFVSDELIHPSLSEGFGPIRSVWEISVDRDLGQGRFRPAYYFLRFFQVELWGIDSRSWHATRLFIGIATCVFLCLAGRAAGLGWIESLLLAAWSAFQAGSGEIWFRIGPSEPYAVLFLAISLFGLAKAARSGGAGPWDWIAVAAMALMGASKENFVPVIPVLLVLRVGLQCGFDVKSAIPAIRSAWKPLLLGAAVFTAEFALVLSLYARGGYGQGVANQVANPFSPAAWGSLLWAVRARFAYYVPVLGAILAVGHDRFRGRKGNPVSLVLLMLGLAVAIPQLFLLRPEWLGTRYFYPAAVALAAISAVAVQRTRTVKALWLLVVTACIALLIPPALGVFASAQQFSAQTQALKRMTDTVIEQSDPDKAVVLYAHPIWRWEATVGVAHLLGVRGSSSPIYIHFTGDLEKQMGLAAAFLRGQFPGRLDTTSVSEENLEELRGSAGEPLGKALALDNVGSIILLESDQVFAANPPPWFDPERARLVTIQEPAYYQRGFRVALDSPKQAWVQIIE